MASKLPMPTWLQIVLAVVAVGGTGSAGFGLEFLSQARYADNAEYVDIIDVQRLQAELRMTQKIAALSERVAILEEARKVTPHEHN